VDENNEENSQPGPAVPPPFGAESTTPTSPTPPTPEPLEPTQPAQPTPPSPAPPTPPVTPPSQPMAPPPPPPSIGEYYANNQGFGTTIKNDSFAVASLVLGVVSIAMALCCGLFVIPLAGTGLVLGIIANNRISQSNGAIGGKPLALSGIICSIVAFVILALTFFVSSIFMFI
jgi:hypothetical protein